MGKYRYLVETPGGMAEFRKDYHIPDNVHLILAEKDVIPWEKKASSLLPFNP